MSIGVCEARRVKGGSGGCAQVQEGDEPRRGMEQKGYVTSQLEEGPTSGPSRRVYSPTALGLRALFASQILHGDLPLGASGR